MYCTQIEKNTTYYLEVFMTGSDGEPVTGLTINYSIYNCATNSLISSGTLTEIGNGVYQSSYQFNTVGQYRIIYDTPSTYEDGIETILVVDKLARESSVASLISMITRVLGLTHENYRLFNVVFDGYDNLLSATVKIYPSATDCKNDTNAIATYEIESTYDNMGRLIDYQMRKI